MGRPFSGTRSPPRCSRRCWERIGLFVGTATSPRLFGDNITTWWWTGPRTRGAWPSITSKEARVAKDNRDLPQILKAELEFLETGGYRSSPKVRWRPHFVFEDSP